MPSETDETAGNVGNNSVGASYRTFLRPLDITCSFIVIVCADAYNVLLVLFAVYCVVRNMVLLRTDPSGMKYACTRKIPEEWTYEEMK